MYSVLQSSGVKIIEEAKRSKSSPSLEMKMFRTLGMAWPPAKGNWLSAPGRVSEGSEGSPYYDLCRLRRGVARGAREGGREGGRSSMESCGYHLYAASRV